MAQRPKRRFVAAIVAAVGWAVEPRADEGMWLPEQIPLLAERLEAAGLGSLDPRAFADLMGHPMGAIVSLGGCSASFVSSEGLVVTNHHCVTGALQYNATPDRNLVRDGFLARTRADEISNGPGARLFVTQRVLEITGELERRLPNDVGDRERHDIVERFQKERTAACEADGSRCRIASFFGGLRWFEIRQMEIRDVRLVYAPAAGIGEYGGETDNWRWPRHTGDFAFLRAYVGPDGKPAPYAKENVPYRPRHWLKVSRRGASPGDGVVVAGYPGSTERHQTYGEILETAEWQLPRAIRRAEEQLAIVDGLASRSPELAIQLEARKRGLHNGLTRNRGTLEGLRRGGILEAKRTQEAALRQWIDQDPGRRTAHGGVLDALDALEAQRTRTRERDAMLGVLLGSNGSLLAAADTIVLLARNRPKPDMDREPEVQERNWTRIREAMERMQRNLSPLIDRAFLRYQLLEASRLDAAQRLEALDRAVGLAPGMAEADAAAAVDRFLDGLYATTKLFDKERRLALLQASEAEIAAAGDPFLDLALALAPSENARREADKERTGARYRLVPRYMQALLARAGGLVAPDANGTLRVTYGRVTGVDARDGVFYKPQTTVPGILEKDTGEGDFAAPRGLLDAARAGRAGAGSPFADPALGVVPVNYLSTVDTTGGNSGSATLNARGELCGLLFDGTYETVASDIVFDPVRTRAIHVDSRYILWVASEVDGAKALLEELGFGATTAGPPR